MTRAKSIPHKKIAGPVGARHKPLPIPVHNVAHAQRKANVGVYKKIFGPTAGRDVTVDRRPRVQNPAAVPNYKEAAARAPTAGRRGGLFQSQHEYVGDLKSGKRRLHSTRGRH